MARSRTRFVSLSQLFPSDDEFSVAVVQLLLRLDDLMVISNRFDEISGNELALAEQMFLVRSSALAIADFARSCEKIAKIPRFTAAMAALPDVRNLFLTEQSNISRVFSQVEHTRDKTAAHWNEGVVRNALRSAAEERGAFTLGTTLEQWDLTLIRIVAAAAMSTKKVMTGGIDMEVIRKQVKTLTDAHNSCLRISDAVVACYDFATHRIRPAT